MILDTNALSALADGNPDLTLTAGRSSPLSLPVIVLGEFRYGIAASCHRSTYEEFLARLIVRVRVLEITQDSAAEYARVRTALREQGRPIPSNDLWIAALARQHNLPLLSRDRHFDAVPGLVRIAW